MHRHNCCATGFSYSAAETTQLAKIEADIEDVTRLCRSELDLASIHAPPYCNQFARRNYGVVCNLNGRYLPTIQGAPSSTFLPQTTGCRNGEETLAFPPDL